VPNLLACLPFDDWASRLVVPQGMDVLVWRPGLPHHPQLSDVTFFVPDYMAGTPLADVVAAMPRLRVVQTLTAGVDGMMAAIPDGVALCNARGVHDASTAELAVGLALSTLRGIPEFVRAQTEQRWWHSDRRSLADRRVVIVGAGSVGRAVAARLQPFEVDLTLVARHARDGVHPVSRLADLLPTAEVVILTVPLTESTKGMVDADFLSRLPDGAVVVNVARGRVIDTNALITELRSRRLFAALDVTDPEPLPPGHPLWSAPQLLLTPHVGGDTTAFLPRAYRLLSEQLGRFARNEPLLNVVVREDLA